MPGFLAIETMHTRLTMFYVGWCDGHQLWLVLLLRSWRIGPHIAWSAAVVATIIVGWSPSIVAHILRYVLLLPVLPLVVSGEPSVGVVMVVAIIVKTVVIVPIIVIMATVIIVPAIVITTAITISPTIVFAAPIVVIAIIVVFPITVVVLVLVSGPWPVVVPVS